MLKENREITLLVAVWLVVHSILSLNRSFWMDELIWMQPLDIQYEGLRSLWHYVTHVGPPFGPGESFFNWLRYLVVHHSNHDEFFVRIPSLLWGAGALLVTDKISKKLGLKILNFFVFFSVSLSWFSTEMRPYSNLIANGAWAFYLLIGDKHEESPADIFVSIFMILFGHIYGICFVIFALLLSRRWKLFAFGSVFFVGLFLQFPHQNWSWKVEAGFPPILQLVKQVSSVVTNSKKTSIVYSAFAFYGIILLAKKEASRAVKISILIGAMIFAPIAATYIGKYSFFPRQSVAALVAVLSLAALGIEKFRPNKYVLAALVAGLAIYPWTSTVLLAQPPFVNNAKFDKYRQVVEKIKGEGIQNVYSTDPCIMPSLEYYYEKTFGTKPMPAPQLTENISRKCVQSGGGTFCISYPKDDNKFCGADDSYYANEQVIIEQIKNQKFELTVFSAGESKLGFSSRAIRTW